MKIYGYARISRKEQNIERQIRNIGKEYPEAIIFQEAFTGTKIEGRKVFDRLLKTVKAGDTIVFDSVSRMSRNADEGVKLYFDLVDNGINLVFLKEGYINSEVYQSEMKDKISLTGTDEDEIFKGLNNYFRKLAQRQIRIAFDQAQKEVEDLHQRTREGIETARLAGKQIGQVSGKKLTVKKAIEAKSVIMKHSKKFYGTLSDPEVIKLAGISRNSYYKYCKEIIEQGSTPVAM